MKWALLPLILGFASVGVARQQDDPSFQLLSALSRGEVAKVRELLNKGADPNTCYLDGPGPPLADIGGSADQAFEIARLLIDKGADVNKCFQDGTPLVHAIAELRAPYKLINLLLDHGADPALASPMDGVTPIYAAVEIGDIATVQKLLARKVPLDAPIRSPYAPRPNVAGMESFYKEFREEEAHHFEPGYFPSGQSALFGLAKTWNQQIANELVKAGVNLKATDDNGWSPLHLAANNGNVEAIRGLAGLGLDVNAASKGGCRPLHAVMTGDHPNGETIKALIECGALISAINGQGKTPIDLLREEAIYRVTNPSRDPGKEMKEGAIQPYLRGVNDAAKVLDGGAKPILPTRYRPNLQGETYAPFDGPGGIVTRRVWVENGFTVLELTFAKNEFPQQLNITALSLENFDTLSPLPLAINEFGKEKTTFKFRFPLEAATHGGSLYLSWTHGPNGDNGMGEAGDSGRFEPIFKLDKALTVHQDLEGRVMQIDIVHASSGEETFPKLESHSFRLDGTKPIEILDYLPGSNPLELKFRFRFLPNTIWHSGETTVSPSGLRELPQ